MTAINNFPKPLVIVIKNIYFCKMTLMKKSAGMLVETKHGIGYTKNTDKLINGKQPVYLSQNEAKILCDPDKLKVVGYYD